MLADDLDVVIGVDTHKHTHTAAALSATGGVLAKDEPGGESELVKAGETSSYADLMSASGVGSLIQATVGSLGGDGRRCPNRAGLAA